MINTDFLHGHRLEVYTTTWCPDCSRLKRWLDEQGIAHGAVDIEAQPRAATKLEAETGKRAVPFILVNGVIWVRGYHREEPGRFSPRVLVDELTEALSGV